MDDMVIGLVTTGFDKGGLEQVVFNLYEGYRKMGIKTYILCQNGDSMGYFASQLHDVRDFCIFEDDMETFISYCYRKRITHLHYHYNTSFIELARECGIQTIYTIHTAYTWFDDVTIHRYGDMLKKCDEIVAVSSFTKNYFCSRGGVRPDCVTVIPNGIDTAELTKSIDLPEGLTRGGLHIEDKDVVFAQVASYSMYKHQIGLIGVMERVIEKNHNIKLVIVGNALEEGYQTEFVRELNESPAKDNIICVNYFDHKYMGEFLRKTVDVAVLASIQEGCSNFVLEAMVCKTPMILTKVGNALDVQTTGILVAEPAYSDIQELRSQEIWELAYKKNGKNTDELADQFLYAADNLEKLKKAASTWDKQIEQLDVQHMVESYLEILRGLRPCIG